MDHGTNVECQHRDPWGNHYPNCPLPECIDGTLCCQAHLVKDRKPALTFDAAANMRLCAECIAEAAKPVPPIETGSCAACPNTQGLLVVTLLNKSKICLCGACRQTACSLIDEGATEREAKFAPLGRLSDKAGSLAQHARAGARAITVSVERSPGGGHNWNIEVDGAVDFKRFTRDREAIDFAMRVLGGLGAGPEERARVAGLLERELRRVNRAVVTAEVPAGGKAAA